MGLGTAGPKPVCSEVLVTEGGFQCHYFLLEKASQLLRCNSHTGRGVRSPSRQRDTGLVVHLSVLCDHPQPTEEGSAKCLFS